MNVSIILAAGEGTRMKSNKPKVLHKICGKPILEYVIRASKNAHVDKNYIIIGHGGDKVKEEFEDSDIIFKTQPIGEGYPYGTGYAVMQAIDCIQDDDNVVILYGDTPLIRSNTIEDLMAYHKSHGYDGTVLTANLDDPTGYGRILRDKQGCILGIVEHKDATQEELNIKEINSGIYCFNGKLLKYALSKIDNNNAQSEYYVTDVIKILKEEGYNVGAYTIDEATEIYGINSRVQLAYCEQIMRKRINRRHMMEGATLINPENTYIEDGVSIGKDSIIYPGTVLLGNTTIGEGCIIGENCRIENSQIGYGVEVYSSTITESTVDEGCHIGPYAHLRPNSHLGKNIKIGNFVEVKNSTVGDNSKAGHLAYIGDADVGKNVNIGCGVVFVNYNGRRKFRSTVEDNAFIGSNANLVAPVVVKPWGYVAAGSTITEDVSEGSLSIARARQVNKEGWIDKKGYKKDK
ncbi:bifunctional UDP-N-acetylglucosamine diphosphorylase/glucosamine-1-phosphate N-acetyltransferase GlmU [Clostridium sp. Cult3]|jgi:bifunctional UDP-N-acetylglucosamine pyrophosphorylase/glucosamine-1-phosphate N-acetyltransferase|uniref:bifunctional UDP-N-acetylglucosamine diphosphorylase/glucosamine-1-phosphate N-acetyltransferase GlmU n=1 Tax=Clostridium sp. Cult3 TaxID=2079004 RepID=UPI001F031083|nr:bifunctional UDP-N-acetylglucosamine diphosphorylase/glucosamine-1-phosphate N-acetyltransferase GlmU [Clostridium sp. Cult3]MCF6461133.1 bifunctional UDP-N-acetylglucosamine diphosphorylase/glucosamine-1-phosphate N-acetyltransferase GlmU [Clostridium sp. Cult3]